MIGFSTPFDFSAVDFLENLNVPFYKIASFENHDLPLLKYVDKTGKPIIMSTAMIQLEELQESVHVLKKNGCPEVVLLKCTSTYPAIPKDTNLLTINDMQKQFPDCVIGLSDHTLIFRRSLYAVKDIKKGEQFTPENIRSIRPANGLSTKFYEEILGKSAKYDIDSGVPLKEDIISGFTIMKG
jgi:sialic acid synthase SpsE